MPTHSSELDLVVAQGMKPSYPYAILMHRIDPMSPRGCYIKHFPAVSAASNITSRSVLLCSLIKPVNLRYSWSKGNREECYERIELFVRCRALCRTERSRYRLENVKLICPMQGFRLIWAQLASTGLVYCFWIGSVCFRCCNSSSFFLWHHAPFVTVVTWIALISPPKWNWPAMQGFRLRISLMCFRWVVTDIDSSVLSTFVVVVPRQSFFVFRNCYHFAKIGDSVTLRLSQFWLLIQRTSTQLSTREVSSQQKIYAARAHDLLEQQQLWHLDCQLWRSWAIYPNAKTLGLSDMPTPS